MPLSELSTTQPLDDWRIALGVACRADCSADPTQLLELHRRTESHNKQPTTHQDRLWVRGSAMYRSLYFLPPRTLNRGRDTVR